MEEEIKKPEEESADELKELLKKNLKYSEEVHRLVRKIRHYIWWQTFMGVIWFVLIVGPIILAVIFLPPYFRQIGQIYQNLEKTVGNSEEGIQGIIQQLKK